MSEEAKETTPLVRRTSSSGSRDDDENTGIFKSDTQKILFVGLVLLVCGVLTLYFDSPLFKKNQSGILNYVDGLVVSGNKYYFKCVQLDQYVHVDGGPDHYLALSSADPWVFGSALEANIITPQCVKFKSSSGNWVRNNNGVIVADKPDITTADCFLLQSRASNPNQFGIKLQSTVSEYLSLSPNQNSNKGVVESVLAPSVIHRYMAWFTVEPVKPIRGVNLGGWFIPEYWMMPSFYKNSGLKWGASLCSYVKKNRKEAEKSMLNNLKTWVNESDIREIAALGFNSIRLPIGYWNIIDDPYNMYVPSRNDSVKYIDWCMTTAAKYNISVLIDLHGAPGSQNGNDHSGCIQNVEWLEGKNIKYTVKAVEAIAERYSSFPNFLGVGLLNEPSATIESANHTALLDFYEKSYKIIRSYSSSALVVFNELYSAEFDSWSHDLREPKYYNVIMDLHLYDWQGNFTRESAAAHISDARQYATLIDSLNTRHPVVVGEWSYSTGMLFITV
jgi:hypothetical protein